MICRWLTSLFQQIQLDAWYTSLVSNPSGVRSLADLIAFNDANPALEEPPRFEDQSEYVFTRKSCYDTLTLWTRLIESEATSGMNSTYFQSLAFDKDLGATRGIDAALKMFNLDALILPAPGFTTVPAAIAGYPIVTGT